MYLLESHLLSWLIHATVYGMLTLLSSWQNHPIYEDLQVIAERPFWEIRGIILTRLLPQTLIPREWQWETIKLPNEKWFRLLRMVDVNEHNLVGFSIPKFSQHKAPSYRALPYPWGRTEGPSYLGDGELVNIPLYENKRRVPMTLIFAMQEIWALNLSKYYWIDAMCINQLNNQERSQQVNIMHRIYQDASAVDVWLGRARSDTPKVNQISQYLARLEDQEQQQLPEADEVVRWPWYHGELIISPSDWDTFADFLSRRWFHRLWAMQEFALAKQARMRCGNVTINLEDLQKAARFLARHEVNIPLSYGNERRSTIATIYNLELVRNAVHGIEGPHLGFLECFQDADPNSPVEFETLLVWVYWRSMSSFATDARDYVFAITAVARAIADRMSLKYEPFLANYSMSTAEAFQAFTERVMRGRFGIRALSLVRQSNEFVRRHAGESFTLGRPSWVPDLANRDWFGLSTNGGRKPYEEIRGSSRCQNILGRHVASEKGAKPVVNGSSLHIRASRIGEVIGTANKPFPRDSSVEECADFVWSLVPTLRALHWPYVDSNETAVQALLHTFNLDSSFSQAGNTPESFNSDAFSRLLTQVVMRSLWSGTLASRNQSVEQTIARLFQDPLNNIWRVPGLTPEIISPDALASYGKRHQLSWLLQANDTLSDDVSDNLEALSQSCRALRHTFGSRVFGTRLFFVTLDEVHSVKVKVASPGKWPWPPKVVLLGLGSDTVIPDDEIWAASGSEWPFILGRDPALHGWPIRNRFVFRGEAYVHSIMRGELFHEEEPVWEEVILD